MEIQGPRIDFNLSELTLEGLAAIGEALDHYGDVRVFGVLRAEEHEHRSSEEWLRQMSDFNAKPTPQEEKFLHLCDVAKVEAFQWAGRCLYPALSNAGVFSGKLHGFLIRHGGHPASMDGAVNQRCPLLSGGQFPTEGAVRYPCGCVMAIAKFGFYQDKDFDTSFTEALVALELETKQRAPLP